VNFTPYEMKILLDVYAGAPISANEYAPIFYPTLRALEDAGLVAPGAIHRWAATPKLVSLMEVVLNAPRPTLAAARPRLSPSQTGIFTFLLEYAKQHGFAPTRAEIMAHFGYKSPNAANDHLLALEKKGYVQLGSGQARAIRCIP
jgi:hypothetical protein